MNLKQHFLFVFAFIKQQQRRNWFFSAGLVHTFWHFIDSW